MKKIFLFFSISMLFSCSKKLDLKPDSAIVVPTTAKDLELILDNTNVMSKTPALPQISADEYFITSTQAWQSIFATTARNACLWQADIYGGETKIEDWTNPFSAIFYSNNILDILASQNITNDNEKKILKGWALFARGYSYYSLVSTFSKGYDLNTASNDLGIPIKLSAGIDVIVQRSSVQQTYDQIIKDVLESSELLQQDIISGKRNRPSKVAAFSLLARVYLSMRIYTKAEEYADKALMIYSKLTDFNTISKTTIPAFTFDSEEVIYFTEQLSNYTEISGNRLNVTYGISKELINLYNASDLRLQIYFQKNSIGNYNTKPINSLGTRPFTGLATDEIVLIKAECLARRGETSSALSFLNQLVSKRWDPNATNPSKAYENITANSPQIALDKILDERRKALVWRGLRWTDIKRLNLEGRNITLTRDLSGQIFTLTPNSSRYVLPIPDDEVALSGVKQNIR